MLKCTNAGGQTKRANERLFVCCPPAWRRRRNVKTTFGMNIARSTTQPRSLKNIVESNDFQSYP